VRVRLRVRVRVRVRVRELQSVRDATFNMQRLITPFFTPMSFSISYCGVKKQVFRPNRTTIKKSWSGMTSCLQRVKKRQKNLSLLRSHDVTRPRQEKEQTERE